MNCKACGGQARVASALNHPKICTIYEIGEHGGRAGVSIYNAGPGLVEKEKGSWGLFERQDDWPSVAYFYLDKPEDNLPPIDPPEQRMKGLGWGGPYFGDTH